VIWADRGVVVGGLFGVSVASFAPSRRVRFVTVTLGRASIGLSKETSCEKETMMVARRVGPALRPRRLAAAAVGVSLCLTLSCGEGSPTASGGPPASAELASEPSTNAEGSEVVVAKSVTELAEYSTDVVKATVVSVEPGRVAGTEPETQFRYRQISLRVDEVLASKNGITPGSSIELEEEGWMVKNGQGYTVNGITWSKGEESSLYFLTLKNESGLAGPRYRLTNSASRYIETGENQLAATESGSKLIQRDQDLPEQAKTSVDVFVREMRGRRLQERVGKRPQVFGSK
jgi:hypothetical protein